MSNRLEAIKIIDAQTIEASGTYTTNPIGTSIRELKGNISLQIILTGTGTAKFEIEQSNNYNQATKVGDWVKPAAGYSIVSGFTATSGTASNGKDLMNVPMTNSQFFRIVATETGGANPVVVNAWLSVQ